MKNTFFLEDNLPTFTAQVPEKIMELHHLAEAMRDLASKPGPDDDINLLEGQEMRVEPVYAIMGLEPPNKIYFAQQSWVSVSKLTHQWTDEWFQRWFMIRSSEWFEKD